MKENFIGMAIVMIFAFSSCNRSDDISPGSEETIQREEDSSDELFRENATPDNLSPRGSTEKDAMSTEDAVID